jgi:ABC-type taurine transport system ATPase subunit
MEYNDNLVDEVLEEIPEVINVSDRLIILDSSNPNLVNYDKWLFDFVRTYVDYTNSKNIKNMKKFVSTGLTGISKIVNNFNKINNFKNKGENKNDN